MSSCKRSHQRGYPQALPSSSLFRGVGFPSGSMFVLLKHIEDRQRIVFLVKHAPRSNGPIRYGRFPPKNTLYFPTRNAEKHLVNRRQNSRCPSGVFG